MLSQESTKQCHSLCCTSNTQDFCTEFPKSTVLASLSGISAPTVVRVLQRKAACGTSPSEGWRQDMDSIDSCGFKGFLRPKPPNFKSKLPVGLSVWPGRRSLEHVIHDEWFFWKLHTLTIRNDWWIIIYNRSSVGPCGKLLSPNPTIQYLRTPNGQKQLGSSRTVCFSAAIDQAHQTPIA